MSKRRFTVEDRLRVNAIDVDWKAHISIKNPDLCRECRTKPCTLLCPARCYVMFADGSIAFSYDGCLECGTCRLICPYDNIAWDYPKSGGGVYYRFT